MSAARPSPPARVLLLLVAAYQRVPRLGPPRCRFAPTCSHYGQEALLRHGALRGSGLILRRLSRCHPFHPGGVDHVPAAPGPSRQGAGS